MMPDQDALARHDAALKRLGDRVDHAERAIGTLEAKMDATVRALDANTDSNRALGCAIDRLSEYVVRLDRRLDSAETAHSTHLVDAERERGTVRRVSLYAWLWLTGALVMAAGWFLTIMRPEIGTAIRSAMHTMGDGA